MGKALDRITRLRYPDKKFEGEKKARRTYFSLAESTLKTHGLGDEITGKKYWDPETMDGFLTGKYLDEVFEKVLWLINGCKIFHCAHLPEFKYLVKARRNIVRLVYPYSALVLSRMLWGTYD